MISRVVAALADSALLLPASVLLFVYLLALGQVRLAAAWALALGLAGSITLAAKLVFHACGQAVSDGDIVSPSGHASFAVIFYGALAIVVGSGRPAPVRPLLAAGTLLLVAAVGVSRVRTGAHTPAEVAIGIAIGAAALAVFALLHARAGRPGVPWRPVVAGFAAALLLLGGLHFSLEHRIGRIARQVSAALDVCAGPERADLSGPPSGRR